MSDEEKGFLARWSQRKREAAKAEPQPTEADKPEQQAAEPSTASGDAELPFDLESLPKLEELTKDTDMTVFFRKGVPESIRNAALRKAWALDPAIRNYVNPALEYAYDWNAPGGVPGGGELGAGVDVARLVSQIMGEPAAEPINFDANVKDEAAAGSPVAPAERDLPAEPREDLPVQSLRQSEEPAAETEAVSKAEHDAGEPAPDDGSQLAKPAAPQQPVRRHGTAKPIV